MEIEYIKTYKKLLTIWILINLYFKFVFILFVFYANML